jgi:predicted enzyme related to lactoylglutathione lyase
VWIHFDWVSADRTRDDEVQRILALGAKLYEDHRTAEGLGWVTLLDPEDNEFCIERSDRERELQKAEA